MDECDFEAWAEAVGLDVSGMDQAAKRKALVSLNKVQASRKKRRS